MGKQEVIKRYYILCLGLIIAGFGVSFAKIAQLGVSPISSTANVVSEYFSQISLGNWIIIWNCILLLGQITILRKEFKMIEFLQIPISFIFGYCTDFGMFLFGWIPTEHYWVQLVLVFVSVMVLAFGLSLSVIANVVMNSGEAFVNAIARKGHKEFGNVKIAFDCSCVTIAVLVSCIIFDFHIIGIREGTVISALFTGYVVKRFSRYLKEPLQAWFTK